MPNLLKIGAQVINLDLVTDMVVMTDEIIVYLSASAGQCDQIQSRMLRFAGAEAERLRAWLNMHTTELAPAPQAGRHVVTVVMQRTLARLSPSVSNLLCAAGGTGRALQRSLFHHKLS